MIIVLSQSILRHLQFFGSLTSGVGQWAQSQRSHSTTSSEQSAPELRQTTAEAFLVKDSTLSRKEATVVLLHYGKGQCISQS